MKVNPMKDNLPNRLLLLMSDGRWHTNYELADKISHRFSATIHVLKKQGYKFEKRHVQGPVREYRLVSDR